MVMLRMKSPFSERLRKLIRHAFARVLHDDRRARLILMRRPSAEGRAWLKYDDDGGEIDADLKDVDLLALIEG
mgnify:CR=1 FL=1